jgi:hypothetical protein
MAANEIPERIAAHAWVRLSPSPENVDELGAAGVGIRSQVGFSNALLGSSSIDSSYPLLILVLDRELSRKQHHAIAYSVGTVDELGRSYPAVTPGSSPNLYAVQPFLLAWLGNPAAPSWLPFGPDPVPAPARDLDRFDALAISLVSNDGGEGPDWTSAGDLVALVLACAPQESASVFLPAIPSPTPPAEKILYRYFAPSAEGNSETGVTAWIDEGDPPPSDMIIPADPGQPLLHSGNPELNNLQTVYTPSDEARFCWANFPSVGPFSMAACGAVDDADNTLSLWQVGNDDEIGLILYWYPEDEGGGGWWLGNGDDQFLGEGTVIALVAAVESDGSYSAIYSVDWGDDQTLTGTVANAAPMNYVQFGGTATDPSTGTVDLGEGLAWSHTALDAGQQSAALLALRTTWQPPTFMLNWFGPSLSPGLVPSWVDLEQGKDAVNPFVPTQPVAAIGLNGLTTVQGSASQPLYCVDLDPTGEDVITIACVVESPEDAEQLFVSLQDDDGNGPNLQYFTAADGPGLFYLVYSDDGTISEQLSSGPGVAAVVATYNPITGQYRVLVSLDWGAPLVFAGTDPTCVLAGDFNSIGFNASIPYLSSEVTQLGQCKVYGWSVFPSDASQTAILDELRATWEPGPVIVPVTSNPAVLPAFTPAALNSTPWQVTIANDFASPNSGYQGILISNDSDGGAGMWLHDSNVALYTIGGGAFEGPITWAAGQAITVIVDPVAQTVEIQGAATGNGVFDSSASPGPWYEVGTDLYVGCYGDTSSYVWQGTISDVTEA